jgi:hypothetical protein
LFKNKEDINTSSLFLNNLNDGITETLPFASISEVSVKDEIEMESVVTTDASESDVDVEEANARAVVEFENQGFSIEVETSFVTARPTMQPIISPTSSLPSSSPSRTGMVAFFEMTSVVTTSLEEDELNAIEAEIIAGFDLSENEIGVEGAIAVAEALKIN